LTNGLIHRFARLTQIFRAGNDLICGNP
jgi:hypothetical protein